ncbi:LOW QUALITY PROTEIN: hypothetical protein PHMEG_00030125 [Phytophthora megakarya]|uniref:Peptidase A2 domain-containing protein n=1 Tax=Phytophthora megakarya TaxID=4795 RepID=A0A225V1W6_9STRA|nr:LOW QUALITY PROTEIN: hypothetical protein PHMEG_00030125 [Phytophthora megakarya]
MPVQNHSTHFCFRRCRLCQQVHDFGKCEAFDELAKILRTNVDKKNISPEFQKLVYGCPPTETGLVPTGQPQSADLVIDAECLYAFTEKCEWPEDNNNNETEKNMVFNGECGVCLDGGTLHEIKEDTTTKKVVNDDWLVSICDANEFTPMHAKTVKLLPGERLGWWSPQRFDRRVRMRALVRGAVNDVTSILLDTGANVSIVTTKLARRLRLDPIEEHGRQLEVQGIQEGKMSTTTRVKAKVTLGWNTVYEFLGSAGSEVVLGTDFMIPAEIRLDLFNATAKLPGEEMVPLVKSLSADEDSAEEMHKRKPSLGTRDVWVRRTAALIPTINRFRKEQPTLVRLMNITDRAVYHPAHLNVIAWIPLGFMPKQAGYVPIDSRKYEQWQVLVYAGSHDETWSKLECELCELWLASQPPLKPNEYLSDGEDSLSQDEQWTLEYVAQNVDSATDGSPVGDDPVSAAVELGASTPTPTECVDIVRGCNNPPTATHSDVKSPEAAVAVLEHTFMCVMHVLSTEGNDGPADDDYAVDEANYISLEDYAQELAFLPNLTETAVTELDYIAPNVKNSSFVGDQQR